MYDNKNLRYALRFLGNRSNQVLDWGSRLTIAATISNALAFMHSKLREDGIPHGNIKSMNILFDKDMEPCLSEYGLMQVDGQDCSDLSKVKAMNESYSDASEENRCSRFDNDVYGFGLVLLELLTGKMVQNNGSDLAKWVHSVVKEEWTVEVFDSSLLSEGASEKRMVNMLLVALRCINHVPGERPSMIQVSEMISSIKGEEDRSTSSETSTLD